MRDWLTCSHCQSSTVLIGSKLLSETLALNPDNNGHNSETPIPSIFEALSLILGFHFPSQLRDEDGQWFSGSCVDYSEMDGDPERHLSLCYSCELVLVNLYKVFNLFTSLSNGKESFILLNSLITGQPLGREFLAEYPDEQNGLPPVPEEGVEVICIEPETESILGRSRVSYTESEQGEDEEELFTPELGQSQGQGFNRGSFDIITLDDEGEDESNDDDEMGADFMERDPLESSPNTQELDQPISPTPRRRNKRRARKVPARFHTNPEPKPKPALSSTTRKRKRRKLTGRSTLQVSQALDIEPERDYRSPSSRHFRCEECGRVYMTAASLMVHTTSAHNYSASETQCPICKRSFAFKSYLSVHMRYHSGERPYSCSLDTCGETFIQLSDLRRHEKRHLDTGLPVIYVRRNRNRPSGVQEFGDSSTNGSQMEEYDLDLNNGNLHIKNEATDHIENSELMIVSTESLFNAT